MNVFSDATLETFAEIFLKTKNKSQPVSNSHPPPPHLLSNYRAALIRLTHDCSILENLKAHHQIYGGLTPHNLFHKGWNPP